VTLAVQRGTDVVDGKVLFAERDHLGPDRIAGRLSGGSAGALLRRQKELALGVAAKAMAQHPETAGGVAEALGYLRRGLLLDEIGAQSLVLAMGRVRGLQKGPGESRYAFLRSDRHTTTISSCYVSVKLLDVVGSGGLPVTAPYARGNSHRDSGLPLLGLPVAMPATCNMRWWLKSAMSRHLLTSSGIL